MNERERRMSAPMVFLLVVAGVLLLVGCLGCLGIIFLVPARLATVPAEPRPSVVETPHAPPEPEEPEQLPGAAEDESGVEPARDEG